MFGEEDALVDLFDESKLTSYPKVNKYKPTDELTVKRIYLLGRIISKIFKDHGLQYWVTGGTLLGCVRHRGLIPWDDDIDICVLDEEKFLSLKNVFIANCLEVTTDHFGYRIYHSEESERLYNYGYPFCDIFIMRENRKKGIIELNSTHSRCLWENEFFLKANIELLREMLYGDFCFQTPNDPMRYLYQTYGDNCLQVGMTHNYDQKTRMYVEREKVDVTNGFHPARPFQ